MKIAINSCRGGFGLSPAAIIKLWELGVQGIAKPVGEYFKDREDDSILSAKSFLADWRKHLEHPGSSPRHIAHVFSPDETLVLHTPMSVEFRSDPLLLQLLEEMGDKANGEFAELKVVEIPDDVDFTIEEVNGKEHIAEKHRKWS